MLEMNNDYRWRRHARRAETLIATAASNPPGARKESLDALYKAVVELTQAINTLETQPVHKG